YAYDLKRLRGYETLIAKSGRTALESLTRDSVDCVILDLEMPGMDGFEVLRSVERLGLRVPVIVYTGTGDYDRCAQAIRLGAYSFIGKAEPMERVAQEGENAIGRRRLTAEVKPLRDGVGPGAPPGGTGPRVQQPKEAVAAWARCWWTLCGACHPRATPGGCAVPATKKSRASLPPRRSTSTPASWPRRTAISRRKSPRSGSARICSIGSTCTCSACRRCAIGCPTFPRWSSTWSPRPARGSA